MAKYNFCLGCMAPLGGNTKCQKCGYEVGTPPEHGALTPGTLLAERFVAGKVIARDGEGITYIAMDMENKRKVTVTEFMPGALCRRRDNSDAIAPETGCEGAYSDYLSDFLEVHRAVARVSDMSAIVPLIDLFECNNTAYAVYKYVQGKPFSELMRKAKRLSWEEARPIFIPLVSALASAQKIGLVHFAIDPENIIMNTSGALMLKGFGVPDGRMAETDLHAKLSDGYSAFEQYSAEGEKGKWTDVYSMAAVMLYALTGKRLPDAVSRSYESRLNIPAAIASEIPAHVVSAIAKALQVDPAKRTRTMEQFFNDLVSKNDNRPAAVRPSEMRTQDSRPSGFGMGPSDLKPRQQAPASGHSQNQGQQRQRPAERSAPVKNNNQPQPWYKNLSQFQYWLLTMCLAIIVLGTIGVIVFFAVRSNISGNKPTSSVVYKDDITAPVVSNSETMYEVPNFVGQDWNELKANGEYIGRFELMETGSKYSDDYGVGVVMQQGTAPGTKVRAGTPIAITVSLGSEKCRVPNIIGMTVTQADEALTNSGLRMGSQTEEYNDSYDAGKIIALEGVSVGDSINRDSFVNVRVSLGHEG